jgi:prepilin-type N-terminal cleavage/methylation domain-containing protein
MGGSGMVQRLDTTRGYTLVEMLMVVAIGLTLMSLATISVGRAITTVRGDGALYTIMAQLRKARQAAISQSRVSAFWFQLPNEMLIYRVETSGDLTLLNQIFLEGNVQFVQFASVPDTPDGFGAASSVDFDGEVPRFIEDGSLVDASGATLSGTVFLGIQDDPLSARAVTIFGGTGQG